MTRSSNDSSRSRWRGSRRIHKRLRSPLALTALFALTLAVGSLILLAWVVLAANQFSPVGAQPRRTIEVSMADGLRFEPDRLTVHSGETIRFVIANPTPIDHEFVIGDEAAQRKHEDEMANGMMHDDAHAVTVPAGQTRELIYTFGAPGDLLIGCHVPGHYGARMHADITVTP